MGVGHVAVCRWCVYGGVHLCLWERKKNSEAERAVMQGPAETR